MIEDIKITIKTNKGDIALTIYALNTPITAANFLNLASRGYYNGITFHLSLIHISEPTRPY